MDNISNDTEVLSEQRGVETSDSLISHGPWKVRELVLSTEKIDYIWSEIQKSPSLFSDLTKGKAHAFIEELQNTDSFWLEIVGEQEQLVGIVYLVNLHKVLDADIHLLFFDRKLGDKGLLVKDILEYLFNKFPSLHRITASMPHIYFATKRLAERAGFRREGTKRSSMLINGRWADEVYYGILASEV